MGKPLIAHVADSLAAQCDTVVVCGRAWGGLPALTDRPGPGLGPMGGLCAALHHAREAGYAAVLSAPCDIVGLPTTCVAELASAPAVVDGQWLVGLWPADFHERLEALLRSEGAISARRWVESAGATLKPMPGMRNINRPQDLD
jgi:molybdopterin-guanine dinucleotide biosynthesis protein A